MGLARYYAERQEAGWWEGSNVFEFVSMSKSSQTREVWMFPDSPTPYVPDPKHIGDEGLKDWLEADPPTLEDHRPVAGLRLIEQKNEAGVRKIPLQKAVFAELLREWQFPELETPLISIHVGGCSASVVESKSGTRISMYMNSLRVSRAANTKPRGQPS
jgi:hypothetical protein